MDTYINPYGRDKVDEHLINSLAHRRYGGTLSWLAAEGHDNDQTDGIAANRAIEQLEKFANSGDNFFLLGFMKPHLPFVAPVQYFEIYNTDSITIPKIPDEYLKTLHYRLVSQSVQENYRLISKILWPKRLRKDTMLQFHLWTSKLVGLKKLKRQA